MSSELQSIADKVSKLYTVKDGLTLAQILRAMAASLPK